MAPPPTKDTPPPGPLPPAEDATAREDAIRQDARDLRRGAVVNLVGYVIKIAYAALFPLAFVLYGKREFGIFTFAQGVLLATMRLCLIGLDKAILWWVPRQEPARERRGLRTALVLSAATSAVAALLIAVFLGGWIAGWSGNPDAATSLRLMAASLVPMTLMEVLVGAALGKRRMEAQVFVKEGAVSAFMFACVVGFYFLGWETYGMALAFLVSNVVGLLGAMWAFRRAFPHSQFPEEPLRLPRELWRYTIPMWLTEIANSVLLRLDVLLLGLLTTPELVGIYGVVNSFGNAIRSVRRAFDPIVLAIFSQIGAKRDEQRLRAGFSHATILVIATQLPIYAFLILFTPWILPLLKHGAEVATVPILILCGFWIVNGIVGLNGHIVNGYGRADLTLYNTLVTIALEALLLYLLIPGDALVGTAVAVGVAYTIQNIIQAVQARVIAGSWAYTEDVAWMLAVSTLSALVLLGGWWLLGPTGDTAARLGAFGAFLVVTGVGYVALHRAGRLSGTGGARRHGPA